MKLCHSHVSSNKRTPVAYDYKPQVVVFSSWFFSIWSEGLDPWSTALKMLETDVNQRKLQGVPLWILPHLNWIVSLDQITFNNKIK